MARGTKVERGHVVDEEICSYRLSAEQARRLTVEDLEAFLGFLARTRSADLGDAALLYAWHDVVTGALRVSAVAGHDAARLPFEKPIDILEDPAPILSAFLTSSGAGNLVVFPRSPMPVYVARLPVVQ
jgi:hypothetical protein